MNNLDLNIKIAHGPISMLMSLGYVLVAGIGLYLEKALGFLGLSVISTSILACLMAIDFMTGIWKSRRLGIAISSKTAKEGFYEKVVVMIGLLVLVLVLKLTVLPTSAILNVLMLVGGLIEAYSIIGNLIAIRTRKAVTEQDAVTFVLVGLRHKIWRWIKYLLKKGEPGSGDI